MLRVSRMCLAAALLIVSCGSFAFGDASAQAREGSRSLQLLLREAHQPGLGPGDSHGPGGEICPSRWTSMWNSSMPSSCRTGRAVTSGWNCSA